MKKIFLLLVTLTCTVLSQATSTYNFKGIAKDDIITSDGLIEDKEYSGVAYPTVSKPSGTTTLHVSIAGMDGLEMTYSNTADKSHLLIFRENYMQADGKNVVLRFTNVEIGDTITLRVSAKSSTASAVFSAISGAAGPDQTVTDAGSMHDVIFYANANTVEIQETYGGFLIEEAVISPYLCEPWEHIDTLAMCQYDTLHWRNKVINGETIGMFYYADTLKMKDRDCDSLYKAFISVYPVYLMYIVDSIPQGDTAYYDAANNIYLPIGETAYTFQTMMGCDSIHHYVIRYECSDSAHVEDITPISATIQWIPNPEVNEYTICVYTSGTLVAKYIADSLGNSVEVAHMPPFRMRRDTTQSSTEFYVLTLNTLSADTYYDYTIDGTNRYAQQIYHEAGTFHTKEATEGCDPIPANNPNRAQKILLNGHVFIIRGGQLYDITGQHHTSRAE